MPGVDKKIFLVIDNELIAKLTKKCLRYKLLYEILTNYKHGNVISMEKLSKKLKISENKLKQNIRDLNTEYRLKIRQNFLEVNDSETEVKIVI